MITPNDCLSHFFSIIIDPEIVVVTGVLRQWAQLVVIGEGVEPID